MFFGSINDLTICLNHPGTFLLGAYARSKDTIDIDTVYVTVIEEDGKNQAPVVHVNLLRAYAEREPYGVLYNWYTVNTGNLAPVGRHVPTDAEWTVLSNYLGGDSIAGDKMKVTGTTNWHVLNSGATNESGFSAFPGGNRYSSIGEFDDMHVIGGWWSATEDGGKAWECMLYSTTADLSRFLSIKSRGYSVRCLRD